MTVAIVPTLVKSPIRATPAEGATSNAAAMPTTDISVDFASILLGLPIAVSNPQVNQEAVASREAIIAAESSVAAGDPPLLAMLSPPSLNPLGSSQGAMGQAFEASRQARPDPLVTTAASGIAREPLQEPLTIEGTAGDRQQSPAGASAAADPPAKFAVADFAAPPPEPMAANRLEAGSPTSALNTLPGAPSQVVSHEIPRDLQTPLRDPAWASEFGQKLLWFANNEKQLAQLTLHPPQLGSIEITLNLDKDSAKAHFVSPSADVRGAIETAAPRLREMFASAGIELGQVSVGSESLQQQPGGRQEPSHPPRPLAADKAILGIASAGDLPGQSLTDRRGHGLIDVFA
jgi:flagellar hook-length control protein FliK